MRIEHSLSSKSFEAAGILSAKEKKTDKITVEEICASIPTIGVEPVTITVIVGALATVLGYVGSKILNKTVDATTERAGQNLADWMYPSDEMNPFKIDQNGYVYAYQHGGFSKNCKNDPVPPHPIFKPSTATYIEHLRKAPQNAVISQSRLPFAIISGPYGTGKTMVCEGIARGGAWNYFILNGDQLIQLLENENLANRFFRDVRNEKLPTVFVVDEADCLFKPDAEAKTLKAMQKFNTFTSNKDDKIMFLIITTIDFSKITDHAFMTRMNYKITIEMPGPEELTKIILQQSQLILKQTLAASFTPAVCAHLALTVFKGRHGRDVESALMSMSQEAQPLTQKELHDLIQRYFHEN